MYIKILNVIFLWNGNGWKLYINLECEKVIKRIEIVLVGLRLLIINV